MPRFRTFASLGILIVLAGCASTVSNVQTSADGGPIADTAPDGGADESVASDVGPADVIFDAPPADQPPADRPLPDVVPTDAPSAVSVCSLPDAGPSTPVCAGLCGNGHVDMCSMCAPCLPGGDGPPWLDAGVCCNNAAESCDGSDLGGSTCASVGFVGGTLACSGTCTFDLSGCSECLTGPHIAACANPPAPIAGALSLALAPTDSEIGVAWANPSSVYFAHYGADLTLHGSIVCFGPTAPRRVALVTTSSGWLAAVDNSTGVYVYRVGATGAVTGPVTVENGGGIPLFAAGPGGPLLLWTNASEAELAVQLDPTGIPTAPVVSVYSQTVEPEYGSAVATPGGYLVAMRSGDGASVVFLSAEGAVSRPTVFGSQTEYPQVAWTGTDARITWADFGASPPAMRWQRLDATGNPVGSSASLGGIPTYYNYCPIQAQGANSMVLLGGYTGGTGDASRLDFTELDANGSPVIAPFHINQNPTAVFSYRLAPMNNTLVAAWLSIDPNGRLGLAVLTP